jgi:hypothetical protein
MPLQGDDSLALSGALGERATLSVELTEVAMPPRGQTHDAGATGGRTLGSQTRGGDQDPIATIARWPLDVEPGFDQMPYRDPWLSLVRDSMVAYREGRTDVAEWGWTPGIVWRIQTNGAAEELVGADAIFGYHRRLARLTGDTFRQRVVALQAGQGPIVQAFLRSAGRRGHRELDIPTLVIFELAGGRIQVVTEMPGDPPAWNEFWRE